MFLIDGYNLLCAVQKLQSADAEISDIRLCRIIAAYLQKIDDSGEIIFDGIGPPDKTGLQTRRHLEVVFSGRLTDADTVIEHKIAASTGPRHLTVVSSDRRLRTAARRRKADSVKAEAFWQQMQEELNRPEPTPTEPREKREGISEGETDRWLRRFGLEED